MDRNTDAQPNDWDGGDTLPDVPDAGDDAQPLLPPEPIDISSSTIAADGAQLAGAVGDDRTWYEQALDVFKDDRDTPAPALDALDAAADTSVAKDDETGAQIYPS